MLTKNSHRLAGHKQQQQQRHRQQKQTQQQQQQTLPGNADSKETGVAKRLLQL